MPPKPRLLPKLEVRKKRSWGLYVVWFLCVLLWMISVVVAESMRTECVTLADCGPTGVACTAGVCECQDGDPTYRCGYTAEYIINWWADGVSLALGFASFTLTLYLVCSYNGEEAEVPPPEETQGTDRLAIFSLLLFVISLVLLCVSLFACPNDGSACKPACSLTAAALFLVSFVLVLYCPLGGNPGGGDPHIL